MVIIYSLFLPKMMSRNESYTTGEGLLAEIVTLEPGEIKL